MFYCPRSKGHPAPPASAISNSSLLNPCKNLRAPTSQLECMTSAARSGGDCRKDIEHQTVGRDGPDEAFADHAVTIDDVGLRYSVYAPIDASTSVAVVADAGVGIADFGQESTRLDPRVLPNQSEELDAARLTKLGKLRRFGAARQAP